MDVQLSSTGYTRNEVVKNIRIHAVAVFFAPKSQQKTFLLNFSFCFFDSIRDLIKGGGKPISAEPLLTVDDARFTAIAINTTRGATVAFIGTDDGRVLKVMFVWVPCFH